MLDTNSFNLTLEQEFILRQTSEALHNATKEECVKFALEAIAQGLIYKNILQAQMLKELGVEKAFKDR